GGAFVVATAQDGKLGTGSGTLLGAALAGHAKALARERADELVKAIDLDPRDGAQSMAAALLAELRSGNASPEVGLRSDGRGVPAPAPAALDAARAQLGPFTAVVHAAGISEDAPAAAKDDAAVLRVLGPKIGGLANLMAATAADPLRVAVLVSSWAGRFGNAGQVDYAAANAALSRAAQLLPVLRPGLRALALEYPPWNG